MKKTVCVVLAMVAGLCFPSVSLAGGKDQQKKNYENEKFVWTENYVVEGLSYFQVQPQLPIS